MTGEQFMSALKQAPFHPFVLHLADGRNVGVRQPEQVAWHPQGRTAVVVQPDESWNVVDLLLVTDLEFIAPEKLAG